MYSTDYPSSSGSYSGLLRALVWRCLLGLAPAYLRDLCCPPPGTRGRSFLRSMKRGLRFVPFACTATSQVRAFSVVGPSVFHWLFNCSLCKVLPSLKAVLLSRARIGIS